MYKSIKNIIEYQLFDRNFTDNSSKYMKMRPFL